MEAQERMLWFHGTKRIDLDSAWKLYTVIIYLIKGTNETDTESNTYQVKSSNPAFNKTAFLC